MTRSLQRSKAYLIVAALCCASLHTVAGAASSPPARTFSATLRAEAVAYEHGSGVAKDVPRAIALYCDAARLGDAEAQFALGWIYAYGRGVPRNDVLAAFFFKAAAVQGIEQAERMLQAVGEPGDAFPDCMIEPPPLVARIAAAARPVPPVPSPVLATAPQALAALVEKMAPAYHIEPQLVLAIMAAESNFDSRAVSPKNAMGLMQLMPDTAARFNVKDPFDARQNIRGGLAYLRWLLAYFEGDLTLVTAAYNAGEGTVERYRGVPPFAETRSYVRRVVEAAGLRTHSFDAGVAQPSPVLRRLRELEARSLARSAR